VVFLARNIPIVRTFVSFPAGISKMRLSRFIAYTAVGSFPWCLILGCVGLFMGENWQDIEEILYNLNVIVSIFLLVFIGIFIGLRLKRENKI
jgi:membrane protein DedA with SNARE-associated domain